MTTPSLLYALIPTVVLILVINALNNVCLLKEDICISKRVAGKIYTNLGLSNRDNAILGNGHMDDGKAENLKRRWGNPELSSSSTIPTWGKIIGIGVVIRVWKPGQQARAVMELPQEAERERENTLASHFTVFIFCVPLIVKSIQKPESNGTWEMWLPGIQRQAENDGEWI